MHNNKRGSWRFLVTFCLTVGLSQAPLSASAADPVHDTGLVTVQAHPVTPTLEAYAQIVPMAVVKVRALLPGNLSQLSVVPGSVVSANQVLAQLTGPLMQSRLITRQQTLQTARAAARSAEQALQIARRKYKAQLTTQQRLDRAISNQAATRAAVQIAQAQLRETQAMQTLRAPLDGTVLTVPATDGEQVTPHQVVITLQPTRRLWLRAEYYGAKSTLLQPGQHGQFQPADHSTPIPVSIIAVAPNLQADSARVIELAPDPGTASTAWVSGTWGKLVLTGTPRSVVSVPTSALILDRGHWWVLLHTSTGDRPQQVTPGPSHGWSTTIRAGLQPGQQVVVKNAYLLYHRGIANRYMPPD